MFYSLENLLPSIITDSDWEELIKVGEEFENWRNNPSREMDISKIFSKSNWKLVQLTFSDAGEALTIGIFAAVEPDKHLFYNNPIFQGVNISSPRKPQIRYKILTQESFEKLLKTKSIEVEYSVYNFDDDY
jgi:hypothetical protein